MTLPVRSAALLAACLSLLSAPVARALDSFLVVKETGLDKKVEFKVMSPEEFKAREAEVKAEAALFAKAEEQARKEWKADEGNKSTPFPPGLNPPKVEVVERFTAQDKAQAKLDKLEESESKRAFEPKKTGKLSDADKKRAEARTEREDSLKKGQELLRKKLDELKDKAQEKAGDAAAPAADKPQDKPQAPAKP